MSTAAKTIIGSFITVVIVSQPIVFTAIFTFFFTGSVPGTDITLPFWAMTLVLCSIGYIAIKWLTKDTLYIGDTAHHQQQAKAEARAYVLQHVARSRTKTVTALPKSPQTKRRKRAYQTAPSS